MPKRDRRHDVSHDMSLSRLLTPISILIILDFDRDPNDGLTYQASIGQRTEGI